MDETIQWTDIDVSVKFSEEKKKEALYWIRYCIGYLPEPFIYLPSLGFIQALLDNHEKGILSNGQLAGEIMFHCIGIRNEDMQKGGWVRYEVYDSSHQAYYGTYLADHKGLARQRLSRFLGYTPALEHSLEAEVLLRQVFERDGFHGNYPYGDIDVKAATITRYREALLLQGKATADDSDLIGLDYADAKNNYEMLSVKPINN